MALLTPENIAALLTLTGLELVLGIDNIVFIIVVTAKVEERRQRSARSLGIGLAMISRIALLLVLAWILKLTVPLFTVFGHAVSGKDIVLIGGGLFLLGKATAEIHERAEGSKKESTNNVSGISFTSAVLQIMILDIVFSLDSVITAIGMAKHLWIMIIAIIVSVILMLAFTNAVSRFVMEHPTIQMLAFSFLILVGIFLVAEGFGRHINRGYIYFAMAFSLFVEMLNLRIRKPSPGG